MNLGRTVSDQVARGELFRKSLSGDSFADQSSHDTKHSCSILVQLHIQLVLQFITLQKVRDERTSVPASLVPGVVRCRPDSQLTHTAEEEYLGDSGKGNSEKTHHTIGDVRESNSHILGKVSREFNSGVVEQHTDNGDHRNTSVLALDCPTAFKLGMESGKRN